MNRKSSTRRRRLVVAFATATFILAPMTAALAEGTGAQVDVTTIGTSDSTEDFSDALDQYLTGPVSDSGLPSFDRDRAIADGASDDLIQAGDIYDQMTSS